MLASDSGAAVKHGRRGAGHQALARPVRRGPSQGLRGETEGQDRGARSAVRRRFRDEPLLDSRFRVAGDHRRAVTGELAHRRIQPVRVLSGHDQPGVTHAERLRKRIVDERGADVQYRPPEDGVNGECARRAVAARSAPTRTSPPKLPTVGSFHDDLTGAGCQAESRRHGRRRHNPQDRPGRTAFFDRTTVLTYSIGSTGRPAVLPRRRGGDRCATRDAREGASGSV